MAWLRSYEKEGEIVSANHGEALRDAPECHFEDARILIARWASEHGVRISRVESTTGRNCSHWNPRTLTIRLNVSRKTGNLTGGWTTAAHEFGHALDEKLRPHSHRWHDSTFVELVDDLVRILVQRGWHRSIPEERKAAEVADAATAASRAAARAVREAIKNAPAAVRSRKIEARRAQIARLDRKLKNLATRLKSAKRSLAALERAAAKAGAQPVAQEVTP